MCYFLGLLNSSVFKNFFFLQIDIEFDLLYPGKKDLLIRNFEPFIRKLIHFGSRDTKKFPSVICNAYRDGLYIFYLPHLKYVFLSSISNTEILFYFPIDTLNAIMMLATLLPKPRCTFDYEQSMNPAPNVQDFLQVLPVSYLQYLKKKIDCLLVLFNKKNKTLTTFLLVFPEWMQC